MGQLGAVVLAGGRSSRMGRAKAELEWHGSTLLRRVVGLASRGAGGPVVVVRAAGQSLPALPAGVEVVEDAEVARGPLQGIADGLAALQDLTDAAFVAATDLPWLHPAFVRRVGAALGDADVALPVVGGFPQPLAAVYRTGLAPRAHELLAAGQSRAGALLQVATVHRLDETALLTDLRLREVDPALCSVTGVNDLQAYEQARALPAPQVQVQQPGAVTRTVGAATLGAAARTAGLVLDRHVVVTIDGEPVPADAETPLAPGDVVTLSAGGADA